MNFRKMRLITPEEWKKMANLVHGDDSKMHWKDMASWVTDPDNCHHASKEGDRVCYGYYEAFRWFFSWVSTRHKPIGFRPVVDFSGELTFNGVPLPPGMVITIGTLYMDDKPVRVPENPTSEGDIEDYVLGTELELREPLDDPHYQVKAIYMGKGVCVADRNLLKKISYEDIEQTLVSQSVVSEEMSQEILQFNFAESTDIFALVQLPVDQTIRNNIISSLKDSIASYLENVDDLENDDVGMVDESRREQMIVDVLEHSGLQYTIITPTVIAI